MTVQAYTLIKRKDRRVGHDPVQALTKAHHDIDAMFRELGPDVVVTLAVSAHVPTRRTLSEKNPTE